MQEIIIDDGTAVWQLGHAAVLFVERLYRNPNNPSRGRHYLQEDTYDG